MKTLINFYTFCKDIPSSPVRNFIRSAMWAVLTTSILICSVSNITLAQHRPVQLFQDWKLDLIASGISVSNDSVQYDSASDQLTVPNLLIKYSNKYDLKNTMTRYWVDEDRFSSLAENGVTIEFEFNAPLMIMHGLEGGSESIKIRRIENIADVSMSLNFNLGNMGEIGFSSEFSDWEIEKGVFEFPSSTVEDSNSSKLSWAQVSRIVGSDRYASSRIGKLQYGIDLIKGEEQTFKLAAEDHEVEVLNYNDGIFGEINVARHKSEVDFRSENEKDMESSSTSSSSIRVKSFNFGSMFELLDYPKERTSNRTTFLEEFDTNQYVSDSATSSIKIDRQLVRNISWQQSELDIFGILVLAILDAKLISTEFTVDLVKFLYSLELGTWKLTGFEGIDEDETNSNDSSNVLYKINEIRLVGLSGNRLGEFAVSGLESDTYLEDSSFKLGEFSLNNIELAEYEEIEEFLDSVATQGKLPDDSYETMKYFFPRAFSMNAKEIDVKTAEDVHAPATDIRIDRLSKSFSTIVPPIPTNIEIEGKEIVFPVERIQDQRTAKFLKDLNIDEINISYSGRLYWKESTEELLLDELKINVTNLYEFEASARFSGISRSVLENPQNMQIGMALVSFDFAKLTFMNKGIAEKFIADGAEKLNMSEIMFAQSLAEIAKGELERLAGTEFAELVEAELLTFLLSPQNLSLEFAPKKPVNLFALLVAIATPETIPKILQAEVKANQ